MRGNSHVRCGMGEKAEIISKPYLSLIGGNVALYGADRLSVAGSIFLDAKSDRNFHDFYTVIMGHHMQGRKMFGDIDLYTDVSFFEKNTTGTLYVEGRILKLETVAILKAPPPATEMQ